MLRFKKRFVISAKGKGFVTEADGEWGRCLPLWAEGSNNDTHWFSASRFGNKGVSNLIPCRERAKRQKEGGVAALLLGNGPGEVRTLSD